MTPPQLLVLLALVSLATACTTAAPEPGSLSKGPLPGGLMGYHGEDHEPWSDWERRDAVPMEVTPRGADIVVFDAWEITDWDARERFFDATFHVLSFVRTAVPAEHHPGLHATLALLAADDDALRMEIAFFTREDASAEGLVLRVVEPGGSGVWIEAERPAGDDTAPRWWTLRVEPAFTEAPGLTLHWTTDDTDAVHLGPTAVADPQPSTLDHSWAPVLALWEENLWDAVTQRSHVVPDFDPHRPDPATPLGPGWPPALGLEITPRGLSDFLPHSVFWPRSD